MVSSEKRKLLIGHIHNKDSMGRGSGTSLLIGDNIITKKEESSKDGNLCGTTVAF